MESNRYKMDFEVSFKNRDHARGPNVKRIDQHLQQPKDRISSVSKVLMGYLGQACNLEAALLQEFVVDSITTEVTYLSA